MKKDIRKIRYAVVGLGYIAQIAVLPAFKHAENSELVALISDDPEKLKSLSRKYKVRKTYSYDQYEQCLTSGEIDAVYIALPNSMHCEYTLRAAEQGVHVLCEKPMAVTEDECERMIEVAEENRVKLMIAYRLHFEEANLKAVELAQSGKLGELKLFNSVFTMNVEGGNIRLKRELGGGTLYDIGIYCINAARYLFKAEPSEVFAFSANGGEERFREVDETTSAILRFPDNRLASFTTSFGSYSNSSYQLLGTAGQLKVDSSYDYATEIKHTVEIGRKTREKKFSKRDQFAPELIYFSDCILQDREPEPSGKEGLADVRIIRALYESSRRGRPVSLDDFEKKLRSDLSQEIHCPPVKEPSLIHASPPEMGA